jgi:hypothetical protein
MTTKTDETEPAREAQPERDRTFEALWAISTALQDVAKAELAKGPGIASNAWRALYDAVAEVMGDAPMAQASPVVGRQPVTMPPGFKNPLPVKGGATPTRPDQPIIESAADIRKRKDVAAELERVKRGGR